MTRPVDISDMALYWPATTRAEAYARRAKLYAQEPEGLQAAGKKEEAIQARVLRQAGEAAFAASPMACYEADEWMDHGLELLRQGRYKRAAGLFKRASETCRQGGVARSWDMADAVWNLANALACMGRFKASLRRMEEAGLLLAMQGRLREWVQCGIGLLEIRARRKRTDRDSELFEQLLHTSELLGMTEEQTRLGSHQARASATQRGRRKAVRAQDPPQVRRAIAEVRKLIGRAENAPGGQAPDQRTGVPRSPMPASRRPLQLLSELRCFQTQTRGEVHAHLREGPETDAATQQPGRNGRTAAESQGGQTGTDVPGKPPEGESADADRKMDASLKLIVAHQTRRAVPLLVAAVRAYRAAGKRGLMDLSDALWNLGYVLAMNGSAAGTGLLEQAAVLLARQGRLRDCATCSLVYAAACVEHGRGMAALDSLQVVEQVSLQLQDERMSGLAKWLAGETYLAMDLVGPAFVKIRNAMDLTAKRSEDAELRLIHDWSSDAMQRLVSGCARSVLSHVDSDLRRTVLRLAEVSSNTLTDEQKARLACALEGALSLGVEKDRVSRAIGAIEAANATNLRSDRS